MGALRLAIFSRLSKTDLEQLRSFVSSNASKRGSGRVAQLTTSDMGFGVARTYEQYTDAIVDYRVRSFRDEYEAEAWLADDAGAGS